MTSLASLASVVMPCAGPLAGKRTWKALRTRVRHTQQAVVGAQIKRWRNRTFFSQKPPARVQVVPFLGIQVDQGFSRSGGVVGWEGVCIDGVKSGS